MPSARVRSAVARWAREARENGSICVELFTSQLPTHLAQKRLWKVLDQQALIVR